MIRKTLTVTNPMGIHARAAARLVAVTSRYQSRIILARPHYREEIDGKSILGILMLAASHGSKLVCAVEGPDEHEAFTAIERLFDCQFEEGAGG